MYSVNFEGFDTNLISTAIFSLEISLSSSIFMSSMTRASKAEIQSSILSVISVVKRL
jgi:hypothetical protein